MPDLFDHFICMRQEYAEFIHDAFCAEGVISTVLPLGKHQINFTLVKLRLHNRKSDMTFEFPCLLTRVDSFYQKGNQ
jgi:hypothetical protein